MRADRLLSILLLLQNRGRVTAPQLAAELEVSVRTVYRDLDALAASGVPLYADRGPAGGYRLLGGYRTRLTGFTDNQAGSLPLAGMPEAAEDLGIGADLAAAQLKLQAALPAPLGERARRVQRRFHLDAQGWFRDADPVPHLAPVASALWDDRRLRVHYRRWHGEVRRDLDPLGIVLKGGIWYLVARADEQVRTYRVSRLLAVEVLDETAERPADFDLAAYWAKSASGLETARYRGEALLRVSPRGLRLLPMLFGAAGARAARQAGAPEGDGWVRLSLPVETTAIAVGDLLRLGTDAEVLAPDELRAAVAAAVGELADRYASADAPGRRRAGGGLGG